MCQDAHDDVACSKCGRVGFHSYGCSEGITYVAHVPGSSPFALSKDINALKDRYGHIEGLVISPIGDGAHTNYSDDNYVSQFDNEI